MQTRKNIEGKNGFVRTQEVIALGRGDRIYAYEGAREGRETRPEKPRRALLKFL